jgi:hypothetical protein
LLIVWHMWTCFSISPFLCCCCVLFFAIFLDIQSTYRPLPHLPTVQKNYGWQTDHPNFCQQATRQVLAPLSLEGVHSRSCFLIRGSLSWHIACRGVTTH